MIYQPSTLGTSSNQITFNDQSLSPYFHMEKRTPTRQELREFDIPVPEGSGVADFQTFVGKEYFLLVGTMFPSNDNDWQKGRDMLSTIASLDVEQADPNSDYGYVPYKWTDGNGMGRQLMVKVVKVDQPENINLGEATPFQILAKVKWPFQTSQSNVTKTLSFTTVTPGTSSGLPFGLNVLLAGGTLNTSGQVINQGTAGAYPTFTITGPITNPRITNTDTGEFMEVDVNVPTAGDTLVISYSPTSRNITLNGNSVYGNMLGTSTFFKIKAGTNNLTFTGTSVQAGAACVVSFPNTWPL